MENARRTLLLRADADSATGTGHVMRCLALGQAWQDGGGRAVLAAHRLPPFLKQRLQNEGFDVADVVSDAATAADSEEIVRLAEQWDAAAVVIDGYHFTADYVNRIRSAGCRAAVIDDFGGFVSADVIINPNLYARAADYPAVDASAVLLPGSRFALLRREFRICRQQGVSPRSQVRRILVSCGGSDPGNVTEELVRLLGTVCTADQEIAVILGGAHRDAAAIRRRAAALPCSVHVRQNVDDMAELMLQADLAVAAAGSTVWELACLGVPIAAVVTADNQQKVADCVAACGPGRNLGAARQMTETEFSRIMRPLLQDARTIRRMSAAGLAAVDGQGALRVAQILADPVLTLRPAVERDSRLLWEWRNDPVVRAASFSTDPIPWEDHCRWLSARLQHPDCRILIAEDAAGDPVGQVRLDREGDRATISVSVASGRRTSGLGTALIRAAVNRAFVHEEVRLVEAWIRPENRASQAAFLKAGFRPILSESGDAVCEDTVSGDTVAGLKFVEGTVPSVLPAA